MTTKHKHIICTQQVEIEFRDQKENLFLQEKVANTVKERLLPAMENLFDEKSAGRQIKIESLSLDIGNINIKNWENEFVDATIHSLRLKLNEITGFLSGNEVYEVKYIDDKPCIKNKETAEEQIQTLIYFLKTGSLSWEAQHTDLQQLFESFFNAEKKQRSRDNLKRLIIEGALHSQTSFERFVLQFPERQIINALEALLQLHHTDMLMKKISTLIDSEGISTRENKIISILILLFLADNNNIFEKVKNILQQILTGQRVKLKKKEIFLEKIYLQNSPTERIESLKKIFAETFIDARQSNSDSKKNNEKIKETLTNKEDKETIFFIENAGLVILHPFLEPLFTSVEYFNGKKFHDYDSHRKAVLLSQFLVTGETEIPEHQLVLNKIICGYPLHDPVDFILELTEKEKEEINGLLQSVLKYWTALKTTSAEGLQQSFLQREGKLTDKEDYWLLQVEQKSYDILMSLLPWGIGIIKLPWMEKRIVVEWNS